MTENSQEGDGDEKKRQLPQNPVEIVKLTKSGSITLPKSIREKLEEKQAFAFWQDGEIYMLFPVKEYEIPDLILAETSKSSKSSKSTSGEEGDVLEGSQGEKKKRKRKTSKKGDKTSSGGLQPELTKYFPFPLENQEKIQDAIEASFYKLTEIPPKIDGVIERIKYIILNYGTGRKTNDSRLKHTIILFIDDVVEKIPEQNFIPLIDYLTKKIVPNIDSPFLKEQSLIHLTGTALKANSPELALDLIQQIFAGIDSYDHEFAVMQGIKSLMKELQRLEIPLSEEIQLTVQHNLTKYITGSLSAEIGRIKGEEIENQTEDQIEKEEISKESNLKPPSDEESEEEGLVEGESAEEQSVEGESAEEQSVEGESAEGESAEGEPSEEKIPLELNQKVDSEQTLTQKPNHLILSTENSLEVIEQLESFQMIDAAINAAEKLLERIPTEDVHIESVRQKVNSLNKRHH